MAEDKKGFVLYCDLIHTFKHLSNEQRGMVIMWVLEYTNDKSPKPLDGLLQAVIEPIKQQLKRDLIKWKGETKQRSDAGKKGMESRWKEHNKAKQKITKDNGVINVITEHNKALRGITNITDTVTVTVKDTVTVNVKDILNKRKAGFKKSLHPFLEKYGSDLLNSFYGYWTEHNPNGKKMRFEYSKNQPFDINRRLQTWFNRQQDFKKEKSSAKKEKTDASTIILEKYGLNKV